jgi:hypothetical protein
MRLRVSSFSVGRRVGQGESFSRRAASLGQKVATTRKEEIEKRKNKNDPSRGKDERRRMTEGRRGEQRRRKRREEGRGGDWK